MGKQDRGDTTERNMKKGAPLRPKKEKNESSVLT